MYTADFFVQLYIIYSVKLENIIFHLGVGCYFAKFLVCHYVIHFMFVLYRRLRLYNE